METQEALSCRRIELSEPQLAEKSQVFVSCLTFNTDRFVRFAESEGYSKETVLIPIQAREKTGQLTNSVIERKERGRKNRKSKLFYVNCDYIDINTPEKVRFL